MDEQENNYITLYDLFHFDENNPKEWNGKIYFNHGWTSLDENGKKKKIYTMDLYMNNDSQCTFSLHPFYPGGKPRFKEGQILIIGVQIYDENKYLLTRVVRVEHIKKGVIDQIAEVKDIDEYSKFCGRVMFTLENKQENDVLTFSRFLNKCKVVEILPKPYGGEDFPGYNNVCISMRKLVHYLEDTNLGEEWRQKLKDRCAVYCLYNSHEKKFYIGSAYGKDGVMGRWDVYFKTSHGYNKDLKRIFDLYNQDKNYFLDNFIFSILEVLPLETESDAIIARENHWKEVFHSKDPDIGYNKN